MSSDSIDKIASAVMYEGYLLYPYRPALKNRQRFTFGTLYPQAYCQSHQAGDAWMTQTQCLLIGSDTASVTISVRFLLPVQRTPATLAQSSAEWPLPVAPEYQPLDVLEIGDESFQAWQETLENAVHLSIEHLGNPLQHSLEHQFEFPAAREIGPIWSQGAVVGLLVRERKAIHGRVSISALRLEGQLFRLTIAATNDTRLEYAGATSRDDALSHSLLAAHTIVRANGGEFVSLADPPPEYREAAAACRQVGAWPVLVGQQGSKDAVLSAPIILYDYPQIARESPGDLCDGTEIDEILSLRIMTLTDDERRTGVAIDPYAKRILDRTEQLAREQLLGLHGTFRSPAQA